MTDFSIRKAEIADTEGIAHVHVESWRETYAGIVPDRYLAELSKEDRQKMWTDILAAKRAKQHTLVAEVAGQIVGFVNGGPAREKEHGFDGELGAIYLLQKFQGKGIGKAMFNQLVELLKQEGITSMYLWVVSENKTAQFYERMGGEKGQEKEDDIGGKLVRESLYSWSGL